MNQQLEVVSKKIYGTETETSNIYMIVWQRLANSGINYWHAENEEEVKKDCLFSTRIVKSTIVKLDKGCMPVEIGERG